MRTFEERRILTAHLDQLVTVSLRGYIFFGSAVKILEDITEHVLRRHIDPGHRSNGTGVDTPKSTSSVLSGNLSRVPSKAMDMKNSTSTGSLGSSRERGGGASYGNNKSHAKETPKISMQHVEDEGRFSFHPLSLTVMTPGELSGGRCCCLPNSPWLYWRG